MKEYKNRLTKEEWSRHYNLNILQNVIKQIQIGDVSVWSEELLNITEEKEKILEIGCGSGTSSLWLSKHNRKVTALDYSESSVELIQNAAEILEDDQIRVIRADAMQELPFQEKEFDMAFQSGLLGHFSTEEQISLLQLWKKYCKRIVSMIPNAASVPYRIGKKIQEEKGIWQYGLETPKSSMKAEFMAAGITVEREYSIGSEWALRFLPPNHYIRETYNQMLKEGYPLDEYMQGYLLVTTGVNKERIK